MSEDYPTIHLRFAKSRQPLVKMRVRIMADAVQVEYTLRSNCSSIYVQKQMQYFDLRGRVIPERTVGRASLGLGVTR